MNRSILLIIAVALTLVGCIKHELVTGEKVSHKLLNEHCYAVDDSKHDYERLKRQLDRAELTLAQMRATIMRGEKRSPMAVMLAGYGLQNDQLGAVGWAAGILNNEDIEEQARSQVWLVELRHAKEKYDEIAVLFDEADEIKIQASQKLRQAGITHADCHDAGYW